MRAAADGLLPAEVEAAAGREDLVLTLRRGKRLEGQVLDGAGVPVKGASVAATPWETVGHREMRDSTRTASTDPQGRFVLTSLAEGQYRIEALSDRGSGRAGPVRAGATDVVVVIAGFGRIEGILDGLPSDAPVATVLAERDEEPHRAWPAKVRPADPFSLEQLPPGTWRLRARAGPWLADPVPVVVLSEGETARGIRLRMVRGASVRGVVRDAAGRAVPGAHVSGLDGTILGPRSATTDAAGAFLIEGFFAGEVQVNASVPGSPGARGVATVTVVAGETVEADIVLK